MTPELGVSKTTLMACIVHNYFVNYDTDAGWSHSLEWVLKGIVIKITSLKGKNSASLYYGLVKTRDVMREAEPWDLSSSAPYLKEFHDRDTDIKTEARMPPFHQ
jgi:hypothetical protein